MGREKEDTRVKLTKSLVKNALAEIMKTTTTDKISVSMLCDKAGINRGTFYSHYKDIEQVKKSIKEEFISELKETIWPYVMAAKRDNLTSYDFIFQILNYVKENKAASYIVICTKDEDDFFANIISTFKSLVELVYPAFFGNRKLLDIDLYFEYVCGGAVQIITDWVKNDTFISVEILSEKLNKLIDTTIKFLE